MRKCVILIPLTLNDGTEVSPTVLTEILDRLYARFGGRTIAGTVDGAYRMKDGSRADDVSLEVWMAVDEQRVDELREEASRICRELEQESIYFEMTEAKVELISPTLFEE